MLEEGEGREEVLAEEGEVAGEARVVGGRGSLLTDGRGGERQRTPSLELNSALKKLTVKSPTMILQILVYIPKSLLHQTPPMGP